MSVSRGSMPEPGGEVVEDAVVMGWEELGATEAQVRQVLPSIEGRYLDLMFSGETAQARDLLKAALASAGFGGPA